MKKTKQDFPDLANERILWEKGFIVIGIDEVGRGAFAGPLVVGGVAFPAKQDLDYIRRLEKLGINDSKKLSPNKRKMLSKIIQKEVLAYQISVISVTKINRVGAGKATFMGMRDVVKRLREKLQNQKIFVLIDKFYVKNMRGVGLKNQKGIVHGDEISLSIAAASIIAKVYRDNQMKKLSAKYPVYGFGKNKGYGTAEHRKKLKLHGPSPIHRKAFIKKYI